MDEQEIKNLVTKKIQEIVPTYLKTSAFTDRKLSDTPGDSLSIVNRKYVNLNGTFANRPGSSVATIGQQYFATDLNYPAFFDGTNWRSGAGSILG